MTRTIVTGVIALALVCSASILLRGTMGVCLCTLTIAGIWALMTTRFLGKKGFYNPGVSLAFAISISGLVLLGLLNLPLRVAFRFYEAEFNARLGDGFREIPRPGGSTGPFRIIGRGARGNTEYFLTGGSKFDFHGIVYVRSAEFYNPSGRLRNLGTMEYSIGTKISLGNGWWYIDEDGF